MNIQAVNATTAVIILYGIGIPALINLKLMEIMKQRAIAVKIVFRNVAMIFN